MPRFVNLVFQGGGVRGIAYAGVLQTVPSDVRIQAVGGTSAGALVAGLLAIGKKPDELKSLLEDRALYALIDDADSKRMEFFFEVLRQCRDCIPKKTGRISFLKLWKLWRKSGHVADIATQLWQQGGFHRSDRLRTWLENIFQGKCFKDIEVDDLRIVASDVSQQRYLVYSKAQYPSTLIAEAVHASASIPLFFAPLKLGPRYLVDGGMLSNFPSFLFAQGKYPTIGFRLEELNPPKQIENTLHYLQALILTMTEAHDKERAAPGSFKQYSIPTPSDIKATKFHLTDSDVQRLYQAGVEAGRKINWDRHVSNKQIISYFDPKSDLTLQFSLKQASRLADIYSHEQQWADRVHFDMHVGVRIERDWTAVYFRDTEIHVDGTRPLICMRFTASGNVLNQSLIDNEFTADEMNGKLRKPLIRIPMYNSENEKGFLLFFNSPIWPGETRRMQTSVPMLQEFSQTLGLGQEDQVSFVVRQIAKQHTATIDFEVLIDSELPELGLEPKFGYELKASGRVDDPNTKRSYRRYSARIPQAVVQAVHDFTFKLLP